MRPHQAGSNDLTQQGGRRVGRKSRVGEKIFDQSEALHNNVRTLAANPETGSR